MTDTPPDFRVSDGVGPLTVDGNVNVADGGGSLTVDDGGGSLTVDAVALPLPTGAATSALQTSTNASLASIDAGIPNALGAATISASMPVTIASDQVIPVAQSGTFLVARPAAYTSGTISALAGAVTLTLLEGQSAWDVYASGTFSTGSVLQFQGSLDNTAWFNLNGRRSGDALTNDTTTTLSTDITGGPGPTGGNPSNWRGNLAAIRYFRVVATSFMAGDSISVQISTGTATGTVFLNASIPVGNNTIGAVKVLDTAGNAIGSISDTAGINGLGVSLVATNFVSGASNSTTAQLASGATFTGAIESVYNQQAISILLTSDQVATLTMNQYIDAAGTRRASSFAYVILPNQPFSRSFVANGNYFNLTFKNTGLVATTTLNINTAYGTLPSSSNLGNASVSLDEASGIPLSARPDGFLRVIGDPTTLLIDSFESLDTTNVWTSGGTAPPTTGSGSLNLVTGTAANASSYLFSKPTFGAVTNGFLQQLCLVKIEAAIITGNARFWGLGAGSSPTFSLPCTDGALFEIDSSTGLLYGSVYAGSVRTQRVALVRATDGLYHRYSLYYKSSKIYFEIDNILIGTISFPGFQIANLSALVGSINGPSTLTSAPTFACQVIGLGDSARNSVHLNDGTFPWRRATVKAGGQTPSSSDPALVVTLSPNSQATLPSVNSKFSFGDVTTVATTQTAVSRTTYTEQTTNSAMTLVSSSASDTSAGTGARTVTVTYLDATMSGPFMTTFTMNGTSAVTAGVSNMCFIENIKVTTVGSAGLTAGILSLKAGATIVGTLNAGELQTHWAHHYVPTGKISYISGFSINSSGTTTGSGALFSIKASTPTVANTPEIQVSDFHRLYGQQSSTNTRNYISPIQIVGPARTRVYVTPETATSVTYRASFDYIDN